MTTYKAHIFKERNVGEREEVGLKLFMPDGTPIDISGGGGGGGGTNLYKVETTLNHADILGLLNTPYELVPPTEPDLDYSPASSIPVMVSAFYSFRIGSEVYENLLDTGDRNLLYLAYGSDHSMDAAIATQVSVNPAGVFTISDMNMLSVMTSPNRTFFGEFHTKMFTTGLEIKDNGLYLSFYVPSLSEPLEGGNTTDQLKVKVWYDIFEMI